MAGRVHSPQNNDLASLNQALVQLGLWRREEYNNTRIPLSNHKIKLGCLHPTAFHTNLLLVNGVDLQRKAQKFTLNHQKFCLAVSTAKLPPALPLCAWKSA